MIAHRPLLFSKTPAHIFYYFCSNRGRNRMMDTCLFISSTNNPIQQPSTHNNMTNEVLKALEERRSVRGYTAEMPSQELIDTVIKAGIYAPTGRGAQSPLSLLSPTKLPAICSQASMPKSWAVHTILFMELPLFWLSSLTAPTRHISMTVLSSWAT